MSYLIKKNQVPQIPWWFNCKNSQLYIIVFYVPWSWHDQIFPSNSLQTWLVYLFQTLIWPCKHRGGDGVLKLEKIWFFTWNTPKFFEPPSALRNFLSAPPLTWNPGSTTETHSRTCLMCPTNIRSELDRYLDCQILVWKRWTGKIWIKLEGKLSSCKHTVI